ncbi:MAG: primosomal protein N', partial [Candidatus Kapaibacteriota bacterium]
GVTGSGKTLIYLHSIKKCLEQNKTAIILVPEISLTPQLIERFDNAFPNQIAVLHSRLSNAERLRQWLSILNKEKKIIIGARSAIFAPASNLGLIVVDEEHEPSYKQEDQTPRYNARDLALVRGKIENCVVILGTATPSVNSFYAAIQGKHTLLRIDERADKAKLPDIILIDMLEKRAKKKTFGQFSDTLIHKIIERINKSEGVILFQNRRGFGLLLECRYCGYIPKCPECDVSLTFHKSEQKLKCHYCGYEKKYETTCPKCGKTPMLILGYGTQRVEEELKKILEEFNYHPKVERFDADVVVKNPEKNQILEKFYKGEIDILVGTQLIAKGIDFERVTLVGIINADLQLGIPDFCANERAFQLFTQVAGRAGRRSQFPGEVIIQTTNTKNYAIESFVKNNFLSFFNHEIHNRRTLHYPPFFRLISIELQYQSEETIDEMIFFVKDYIQGMKNAIVLGPVTPIIPKIRGWKRKVFLLKINRLKDPNSKYTSKMLKSLYHNFTKKFSSKKVKLIIDVDTQFSLF